jgi:hypothetical protein
LGLQQVAALLRAHKLPCGNDPVAVCQYATPPHLEEAPESAHAAAGRSAIPAGALAGGWRDVAWPLPKVTRFCGVFRTRGDRRLGDHLLGGLEQLLAELWPLNPRELWQLAAEVNARRGLREPRDERAAEGANAEAPPDGDWGVVATDMLPFLAEPPPPPADLADFCVARETAPPPVALESGLGDSGGGGLGGGGGGLGGPTAVAKVGAAAVGSGSALPGGEAGFTPAGCAVALRLGVAPLFGHVWNGAVATLQAHLNPRSLPRSVDGSAARGEKGEGGGGGGGRSRAASEPSNAPAAEPSAAAESVGEAPRGASVVLLLAWRLGFECGRVQCLLRRGGVSWGTYPDSMGTHCNAHANNMVVLPPQSHPAVATAADHATADAGAAAASAAAGACSFSSSASASGSAGIGGDATAPSAFPAAPVADEECLLAPVDFDMAFTQSSYLPELATAACPGFDAAWPAVLALEAEGFYGTLAGSDFASTGVANRRRRRGSRDSGVEPGDPRRVALRDTLCSGFRCGLAGLEDPRRASFAGRKAALDALVKLCLVVTAGDIA